MIALYDLGAFWREWYASSSQLGSMERVLNSVDYIARTYETVIVCADSPHNWRFELTKEMDKERQYKANRPRKPPEAALALQSTKERLEAIGYPVVERLGYEADDVIATLVHQSGEREVHIFSEDKDLYALIGVNVTQLTRAGHMDTDACVRKFGVRPRQIPDLLAIAGDTADNIAGCPGVGAAKGAALLREFGDLDKLKEAHLEELTAVKGIGKKIAISILEWDPTLARSLVTLATDCPVDIEPVIASYVSQVEDSDIAIGF